MAMTNDLISQLRALHLYGMAAALEELLAERPRTTAAPLAWIRCLIEAEQVERQVRSLRYQLRVARFPIHRELDHFQWEESDVKRELIEPLANGEFTQEANNLILVGSTETLT
jgi:DNA replication protein DnaC